MQVWYFLPTFLSVVDDQVGGITAQFFFFERDVSFLRKNHHMA